MQTSLRLQGIDIKIPIELYIYGRDNEIETVRSTLNLCGVSRVQRLVSSELERLLALRFTGGESSNFTAPFTEKLKRNVAKTTNTDHSHLVSRFHIELN